MLLINVFYYDSELKFIKNEELNFYMVVTFGVLILLNIFVEIINAVKDAISMIWCKNKKTPKSDKLNKLKIAALTHPEKGKNKIISPDIKNKNKNKFSQVTQKLNNKHKVKVHRKNKI